MARTGDSKCAEPTGRLQMVNNLKRETHRYFTKKRDNEHGILPEISETSKRHVVNLKPRGGVSYSKIGGKL